MDQGKDKAMKRYRLTSSRRVEYVSFETVAEAENFLASRKLGYETVYLLDIVTGSEIFTRDYA